jgi:hypothetical protein
VTFQQGNREQLKGSANRKPRIITQNLISLLNEVDTSDVPKVRRFAEALLARALEGDVAAMNAVMDRVEGKVPQPIAGDPDNPLVISTVVREIVHVNPTQRSNPMPALSNAGDPKAA